MDYKSFEPKIRKDQGKLFSMSALLKKNGIKTTAASVNKKLRQEDYIEKGTRPSTKEDGETREYDKLSIKSVGLFGENYTTEDSLQPSIKWYENTFLTLINGIGFKEA